MFGAAVISAVFAAAGVGCPTYWGWLAVRALSGVGAAGTALGAYILATEAIGERWRGAMGIACQVRPRLR
jgi:OCT family organic cation transporter-like MFS transporter 4/5